MNTGSRLGGDPARRMGDLRSGDRKPELAGLRRDDGTGVATRRCDQLEQRVFAALLSGHAFAAGGFVECVHPIRDLHVTLLHLLGLDDNKLTYFHAGRYKQLSQFGGEVIRELVGE